MINDEEPKAAKPILTQGSATIFPKSNQCSAKSSIYQERQQLNSVILQSVHQKYIILKAAQKSNALSHCACYHRYISLLPELKQMTRTKECLVMLRFIIKFHSLIYTLETEIKSKINIMESFEKDTLSNDLHESMFKEFQSVVETLCYLFDSSTEKFLQLGLFSQMIKSTFSDKIAYFQSVEKIFVFNIASSITEKIRTLLHTLSFLYQTLAKNQSYLLKSKLVNLPTSVLIYRFNNLTSLLSDFNNDLVTNKIFTFKHNATWLPQKQCISFSPLSCPVYSVSEYVRTLAVIRAGEIKSVLLNELVSILNKQPLVNTNCNIIQSIDSEHKTFINSGFLTGASTNNLKQIYKVIMAKERMFTTLLFNDIKETNSSILKGDLNFLLKNLSNVQTSKTIFWDTNIGPIEKENLMSLYMSTLWLKLAQSFRDYYVFSCVEMGFTKRLNNYTFIRDAANMLRVFKKIESAPNSVYLNFLKEAILGISNFHNSQIWDSNICKSMSIFIKDHFRYTEKKPSSKTVLNLLLTQQNIESYYNILSIILSQVSSSWMVDNIILPWLTVCTFLYLCFRNKRQQYLSSGSWGPFFVVAVLDVQSVLLCFQNMVVILKELALRDEYSDCAPFVKLSAMLDSLKSFEEESYKMLNNAISRRAKAAWEQHMPLGKVWKRRGSCESLLLFLNLFALQAHEPSKYIKLVTELILAPIVENLHCLLKEQSIKVLCGCVSKFIKSWMDHILLKEIKFSWFGSQQLLVDFQYFSRWFEQDRLMFSLEDISEIHSLPVFSEMNNALLLISCQPSSSKKGEEPNNTVILSSNSTLSQVSSETFNGSHFDELISAINITQKDHWLSLRVKGGSRKKTLLCIKKQE